MPAKDASFNQVTAVSLLLTGGGIALEVDADHATGVYTGAFDPVGNFDPQPGSLYLRRIDDNTGEVYKKTGAGPFGWTIV